MFCFFLSWGSYYLPNKSKIKEKNPMFSVKCSNALWSSLYSYGEFAYHFALVVCTLDWKLTTHLKSLQDPFRRPDRLAWLLHSNAKGVNTLCGGPSRGPCYETITILERECICRCLQYFAVFSPLSLLQWHSLLKLHTAELISSK